MHYVREKDVSSYRACIEFESGGTGRVRISTDDVLIAAPFICRKSGLREERMNGEKESEGYPSADVREDEERRINEAGWRHRWTAG